MLDSTRFKGVLSRMFSQCSIPEVKEEVVGTALQERRAKIGQFLDLGPPDLVTLVKYIPSSSNNQANGHTQEHHEAGQDRPVEQQQQAVAGLHSSDKLKGETGTFFYSLGVDSSDPTSIAIFLKSIADTIAEEPQAWFGKTRNFHVARISFSTWNVFRKCDVNVVVHIPGTVQTFVVDSQGEQSLIADVHDSDLLWAETFFSGVVRSIALMQDNREEGEVQNVVETLILNPLTSGQLDSVSDVFISLFPLVYTRGAELGGPCYVTNITRTNNYLVQTLVEVVRLTRSVDACRAMLQQLVKEHPEAVVVLVRVLLTNDLEIDAIELAQQALLELQQDARTAPDSDCRAELLCLQADFLLKVKGDYKLAQQIAQMAVNSSPSEFRPWYLLAESYIKLKDVENALLTLNACPMTPLKDKYALKRVAPIPTGNSLHLPLPIDAVYEEVSSLDPQDIQKEHHDADPALANLAASNLKSVFQLAYKLLSEIVQITGWENLLKYRSKIFVMEEEYQVSTDEVDKTAGPVKNIPPTSQPSLQNGDRITNNSKHSLRSKRLCERWLDNLFMLLYEDLKTYTLWQTEQLYFEAQYSKYNKLTFEWELFGLCARRLGHYPEAARAFQRGLSQRFSAECARRLLEYCVQERQRVRIQANSPTTDATSSAIMARINELDNTIIDLVVKICCWNHRWYIEFSIILLDALSEAVQDMGLTKISNEISSRFSESVFQLAKDNILDFFANYTNSYYDN